VPAKKEQNIRIVGKTEFNLGATAHAERERESSWKENRLERTLTNLDLDEENVPPSVILQTSMHKSPQLKGIDVKECVTGSKAPKGAAGSMSPASGAGNLEDVDVSLANVNDQSYHNRKPNELNNISSPQAAKKGGNGNNLIRELSPVHQLKMFQPKKHLHLAS